MTTSTQLPNGFIQSNQTYIAPDEDNHLVDFEDIIRLWRAYSGSKHALANETGIRLEYFFWRILSSRELLLTLRGSQIAMLHAIITQEHPITNTPRPSPSLQSTAFVKVVLPAETPKSGPNGRNDDNRGSNRPDLPEISSSTGRDRSDSRPRPILRAPGIDTSHPGKSARILTPTWGRDGRPDPATNAVSGKKRSSLKVESGKSQPASRESVTISADFESEPGTSRISPVATSLTKSSKNPNAFAVSSKRRRPSMPRRGSSKAVALRSTRPPQQDPLPQRIESPIRTSRAQSLEEPRSEDNQDYTRPFNPPNSFPTVNLPRMNSRSDLPLPRNFSIPTKSSLTTGVTLTGPAAASLQPFGNDDVSSSMTTEDSTIQSNGLVQSSSQSTDTLSRSRSNLNLLLQRDRYRPSDDGRFNGAPRGGERR